MNIKNYTSEVNADKSILRIEKLLVSVGATNVSKEYKNQNVSSITFLININGMSIPFRMEAKTEIVEKILKQDIKRPRPDGSTWIKIAKQAERTTWKILCDWTEIQISMIKLQQAELIEIFLPYAYNMNNGKTFFQSLKESKFKALTE